jgi:integrase
VLIDEPELSLHPTLQLKFLETLAGYASEGVIFATHNLGLARSVAPQIYVVRRSSHTTPPIVAPLHSQEARLTELLGELSFGGFQELGFERVLLVEGVTEILTAFNWGASPRRRLVTASPFYDGEFEMFRETARTRRLESGEAERLLAQCTPHLRAVVETALETGMRLSEILSLQFSQVRWTPKPEIFLEAIKTKTKRDRRIPISLRLKAILEMRTTDPQGEEHDGDKYVLGTAIGTRVLNVKRAWQTAVLKAHDIKPEYNDHKGLTQACRAELKRINLHFHDLRREAGSRWLEGGVPLHVVQAWLGHSNISQTSTYLAVQDVGADAAMKKFDQSRGLTPPPTPPTLQAGANSDRTGI